MTLAPKGQINREGSVSFGDASLSVWEEGIPSPSAGFKERDAWELAFKRQVFARIVQTLRRVGWTVGPWDRAEQYKAIADKHRTCSKGGLQGELSVSGRSIEFKMWQDVTPSENPNGGQYDFDKEDRMPYVLRLEMERTRRRIRDYLCNVFTGYKFDSKHRSIYRKPMQFTAMELIAQSYAESWHFKGEMAAYLKKNGYTELPSYNCTSRDGQRIEHGARVWFKDWNGRIGEGIAYYNINSMWWIVTGRYDRRNISTGDIWVTCPENPRVKRNERQRRKRLEGLLAEATKAMDFDRAKLLKSILWPAPEPLFHIIKNGAYFRPNYCGYTDSQLDAGKYTQAELKPYADGIKRGDLQAIPV